MLFSYSLIISCSEITSSENSDALNHKSFNETNLLDTSSLERGCVAANAWVKENAQNLPTSFATISEYPAEYRKAIFIELTPKKKVNVWTDRLREVLGNVTLTKKQRALVDRFIKDLSPAVYEKNADRGLSISDKTLKSVFGETLAGNIFASLSPVQEIKENQTISIVYGINRIATSSEHGGGRVDCECSTESDWCGLQDCEKTGWSPCDESTWGCGTGWVFACDGLCEW